MRKSFTLLQKFRFSTPKSFNEVFSQNYFYENFKNSSKQSALCSSDVDSKTSIIGVPSSSISEEGMKKSNQISDYLLQNDKSKICLFQLDPSIYIDSKGTMSLQRLQNPKEGFDYSLEDSRLDLALFDGINKEENPESPSITEFLALKNKDPRKSGEVIQLLYTNLLDFAVPEKETVYYNEIVNILLLEAIQNKTIYFGDISFNRYKLLLASLVPLDQLRSIFNDTLQAIENFRIEKNLFNAFFMLYGNFAQIPKDLHLVRAFKQLRKAHPQEEITIFVEMPHFDSMLKHLAVFAGREIEEEKVNIGNNEEFIEKLAILEILCESRAEKSCGEKLRGFMRARIPANDQFDKFLAKYAGLKKESFNKK